MNYSQVLTLINTKLASGTNITAEEHREVETALLDYAQTQNNYVGYMTGVNLPIADGATVAFGGVGIASAVGRTNNRVEVTLTTPMSSIDYYVRFYVESLGVSNQDAQVACPMFQKIDASSFYYIQAETGNITQNLRIHMEVISLD
jgi:hypothetical protein